jgi:hypothetical protein
MLVSIMKIYGNKPLKWFWSRFLIYLGITIFSAQAFIAVAGLSKGNRWATITLIGEIGAVVWLARTRATPSQRRYWDLAVCGVTVSLAVFVLPLSATLSDPWHPGLTAKRVPDVPQNEPAQNATLGEPGGEGRGIGREPAPLMEDPSSTKASSGLALAPIRAGTDVANASGPALRPPP